MISMALCSGIGGHVSNHVADGMDANSLMAKRKWGQDERVGGGESVARFSKLMAQTLRGPLHSTASLHGV